MFELRWLQIDTGKTTMNEWGYYEPVIDRALQYRYRYSRTAYNYNPSVVSGPEQSETVWSDWQDVPVVVVSKELNHA